jgi:hypothetical protein
LLTFLLLFLPLLFTLVLGFGWVEAHTTWSKDGEKKTIPELQRRLIEIINLAKKEKWKIPDNPPSKVPVRKSWTPVGTITKMAIKLGTERDDMAANLDKRARVEWRDRNTRGEGDILQNIQALGDRTIDKSFVGTMIECYVSFDIGTNPDGTKKPRVVGVVLRLKRLVMESGCVPMPGQNATRRTRRLNCSGMRLRSVVYQRAREFRSYPRSCGIRMLKGPGEGH